MKTCKPYSVKIYCGRREGYDGVIYSMDFVKSLLQAYCDKVGFCVSLTETTFIYTDGEESGVIVGLVNYPRFPKEESELEKHAMDIAFVLLKRLKQHRLSIEFPDKMVMIEQEDLENK